MVAKVFEAPATKKCCAELCCGLDGVGRYSHELTQMLPPVCQLYSELADYYRLVRGSTLNLDVSLGGLTHQLLTARMDGKQTVLPSCAAAHFLAAFTHSLLRTYLLIATLRELAYFPSC